MTSTSYLPTYVLYALDADKNRVQYAPHCRACPVLAINNDAHSTSQNAVTHGYTWKEPGKTVSTVNTVRLSGQARCGVA